MGCNRGLRMGLKTELEQVKYLRENLLTQTNKVMADELKCSRSRVRWLLEKYDIKRTKEQVYALKSLICTQQTGSANNNWRGGISKNNYHYKLLQINRYPEKIEARQKAYSALRNGSIKRQDCIICGDPHTEFHHEDYSKPFDVIHVCRRHHIILDRCLRAGINFSQIKELLEPDRMAV